MLSARLWLAEPPWSDETGLKRKARDVAAQVGLSETQFSLFRSGKVKGIRFETLEAICRELDCQPGDLLEWRPDPTEREGGD